MSWREAGQARYDRLRANLGWFQPLAVVAVCLYGALSAVFEIALQAARWYFTGSWRFLTLADMAQPPLADPPWPLRVPIVVLNLAVFCWTLRLCLRVLNGADAREQGQL